jgi:hypothetical protein
MWPRGIALTVTLIVGCMSSAGYDASATVECLRGVATRVSPIEGDEDERIGSEPDRLAEFPEGTVLVVFADTDIDAQLYEATRKQMASVLQANRLDTPTGAIVRRRNVIFEIKKNAGALLPKLDACLREASP